MAIKIVKRNQKLDATLSTIERRFASCEFDPLEKGFDCKCDAVRGFAGDGYNCTPAATCFDNPAICDPNADCIPTRDHKSKCR